MSLESLPRQAVSVVVQKVTPNYVLAAWNIFEQQQQHFFYINNLCA